MFYPVLGDAGPVLSRALDRTCLLALGPPPNGSKTADLQHGQDFNGPSLDVLELTRPPFRFVYKLRVGGCVFGVVLFVVLLPPL